MATPSLQFLFVIQYADGTKYFQDFHDRSRRHPLTKSSWYDAVHYHDLNNEVVKDGHAQVMRTDIVRLSLLDRNDCIHGTVDLTTCTIEAERLKIPPPVWPLFNIRPIYFRRMLVEQHGRYVGIPRIGSYFIGWQALDGTGRNHQQMLEVKG